MNEREKPALEKAADKVNDVVEEIALKAADAAVEPDPVDVASNEQLYLPEASEAVAAQDQSGRVTATVDAEPHSPLKKTVNKEKAKK
jgi:hypothetical protein